jgi:hypothetical protein
MTQQFPSCAALGLQHGERLPMTRTVGNGVRVRAPKPQFGAKSEKVAR